MLGADIMLKCWYQEERSVDLFNIQEYYTCDSENGKYYIISFSQE